MHAVLIEIDVTGVDPEAGLKGLRDHIVPSITQMAGFWDGKGLSLTVWDTEAAATRW